MGKGVVSRHAAGGGQRTVAIVFVMMLGLVSLMADVAIEGTKSVMGTYLVLLGASAAVVGIVSGLAELVGYSLRVLFGWVVDETGRYWAFTFIGYGINIVAVPALALAGSWEAAVVLIMIERIGRAVRGPARDAMISHAGKTVGRGWSFGVQEALSSVGGMIGPIVVVLVLLLGGDYRIGFEIMLLPCIMAVVILAYARRIDPHPGNIKETCPVKEKKRKFTRPFWIFVIAGALIAAGYADFPLISYHMGSVAGVSQGWIPIMYALAMASNALSALAFGRMYDKIGILPLVAMAVVVPFFAPLVFSNDVAAMSAGMLLYGVGFGAQESVMRAVVADMSPHCRRGTAFGCYNAAFGLSWFLGSAVMGMLYDTSLLAMVLLSMGLQFAAIPLFIVVLRGQRSAVSLRRARDLRPEDREPTIQDPGGIVFILEAKSPQGTVEAEAQSPTVLTPALMAGVAEGLASTPATGSEPVASEK